MEFKKMTPVGYRNHLLDVANFFSQCPFLEKEKPRIQKLNYFFYMILL